MTTTTQQETKKCRGQSYCHYFNAASTDAPVINNYYNYYNNTIRAINVDKRRQRPGTDQENTGIWHENVIRRQRTRKERTSVSARGGLPRDISKFVFNLHAIKQVPYIEATK